MKMEVKVQTEEFIENENQHQTQEKDINSSRIRNSKDQSCSNK